MIERNADSTFIFQFTQSGIQPTVNPQTVDYRVTLEKPYKSYRLQTVRVGLGDIWEQIADLFPPETVWAVRCIASTDRVRMSWRIATSPVDNVQYLLPGQISWVEGPFRFDSHLRLRSAGTPDTAISTVEYLLLFN